MKKKKKVKKDKKDQARSVRAKLKAHKAIVRFCLIFVGLLIVLATTFPYLTDKFNPQVYWLNAATAEVTGFFLKPFGMTTRVSGTIISLPNFSVEVVGECTGLYEMLIFLAAMIAYPAGWKKKLMGAGLGIPFLFAVNMVRMIFIMVVGTWSPKTFDFMHLYFWQVAMILIIVSAWVLWIEKVVHYERKTVAVRR
ncbi:MAG: exosortase H [Candidatus Zixiibacteriota bacterium]